MPNAESDAGHHPNCYQNTGVPDDMPAGICDCRVLRMIDAATHPIPPEELTPESFCHACGRLLSEPPVAECVRPHWHRPLPPGDADA